MIDSSTFYFSIEDLANRYSSAKATIYRWIRNGDFPEPIKFGGRSLWDSDSVIKWERKNAEK